MTVKILHNDTESSVDLNLFNEHSDFFINKNPNDQNGKGYIINLNSPKYSDEIIDLFIQYFHTQNIQINNSNAISLFSLSQDYSIKNLNQTTTKYIDEHYFDLIKEYGNKQTDKSQNDQNDLLFLLNLHNFYNNDSLLQFPIDLLCVIFDLYLKTAKQEQLENHIIDLIRFLNGYIRLNGPESIKLVQIFIFKGSSLFEKMSDKINFFSEFDNPKNAKEANKIFIQCLQKMPQSFDALSIISVNYLASKYKYQKLLETTESVIQRNYQVIIENFLKRKDFNDQKEKYEELLSTHLDEFLDNKNFENLPIPTLYRIINRYFETVESKMKPEKRNNTKCKMIDFLMKKMQEKGKGKEEEKDYSVLFDNFKYGKEGIKYLNKQMKDKSKESENYKHELQTAILQNPSFIFDYIEFQEEESQRQQEEIQALKQSYEKRFEALEMQFQFMRKSIYDIGTSNYFPNENVSSFNNLKGESQTFLISELKDKYQSKDMNNINNILTYFSSEQKKSDYKFDSKNYIDINTNDDSQNFNDKNDIKTVTISPNSVDMLYNNGSIKSKEFINHLNNFDRIQIHVQYPSNKYKEKHDIVDEIIKTQVKQLKQTICISKIDEKDQTFQQEQTIKSVKIESPVKIITGGEKCGFFGFCKSLSEVIIPESVTTICKNAFISCTSLEEIVIPSTVTNIESFAFLDCNKLKRITIDPYQTRIDPETFKDCQSLKHLIFYSSVSNVHEFDYDKYFKLNEITIPETVKVISTKSFQLCKSLNTIYFPTLCTFEITQLAFEGIQELNIKGTIKELPNQLFSGCSSLSKIKIPSSVKSIGEFAFYCCESLLQITFPQSLESIGPSSFYKCKSLTQVSIPPSVKSIGDSAFLGCSSLEQISIPSSIDSIDDHVFSNCEKLNKISIQQTSETRITFSDGKYLLYKSSKDGDFDTLVWVKKDIEKADNLSTIKFIKGSAFAGCSKLKEMSIPQSVTFVGSSAFAGCSSLKNVVISPFMKSIEPSTFKDCTALEQVSIPPSVESIGSCAFKDCNKLEQILVPFSATKIGSSAFPKKAKVVKF